MARSDNETDPRLGNAAIHAAGIGAGWFALALLTRQLIDAKSKLERRKYEKELSSALNARFPVISPDFNTKDSALEEAVRAAGVPKMLDLPKEAGAIFNTVWPKVKELSEQALTWWDELTDDTREKLREKYGDDIHKAFKDWRKQEKTAADTSVIRGFMDRYINPLPMPDGPITPRSVLSAFGNPGVHPAHLVLTLAALAAGGGGGWALGRKMSSNSYQDQLEERRKAAMNRLDQLMAEEYARTRGLTKPTPDAGTETEESDLDAALSTQERAEELRDSADGLEKSAEADGERSTIGDAWRAMPKIYLLYATLAGALSAGVAKAYMDDRDPNRARKKAMVENMRARARIKDAPVLFSEPENDPLFGQELPPRKLTDAVNMPHGMHGGQMLSI